MKSRMLRFIKLLYYGDDPRWNTGIRRILTIFIRYGKHIWDKFNQNHCLLRAAALTYTTILTIIPVFVLFFVIFQAFGGLDIVKDKLESFLFTHLLPESVISIRDYIQSLVATFNTKAVSVISVLFLLLTTYGLFASIDSSLNAIWSNPHRRKFYTRLVNLWFILTITPLLLGYSLYLTAQVTDLSQGNFATFTRPFLWISPAFLNWVTLTLLFKFVPLKRVRWFSAILGAFFSAVLWELTKHGFNYYVQNFSNMKLLYGSFILLPLFLVWINVSWIIVLAGAQLAYVHQHAVVLHDIARKNREYDEEPRSMSPYMAIYIMTAVVKPFVKGGNPLTLDELGKQLHGDLSIIEPYIKKLVEENFILAIDGGESYVPSRETTEIKIDDIIECFRFDQIKDDFQETQEFIKYLRLKQKTWISDLNMNDLIRKNWKKKIGGQDDTDFSG